MIQLAVSGASMLSVKAVPHQQKSQPGRDRSSDLLWLAGGTFMMGSDRHYPEEAPAHAATVDGFWIEKHPVTNEQFSRFAHDTGYVTLAERTPRAEDYPGATPETLLPDRSSSGSPRRRSI